MWCDAMMPCCFKAEAFSNNPTENREASPQCFKFGVIISVKNADITAWVTRLVPMGIECCARELSASVK